MIDRRFDGLAQQPVDVDRIAGVDLELLAQLGDIAVDLLHHAVDVADAEPEPVLGVRAHDGEALGGIVVVHRRRDLRAQGHRAHEVLVLGAVGVVMVTDGGDQLIGQTPALAHHRADFGMVESERISLHLRQTLMIAGRRVDLGVVATVGGQESEHTEVLHETGGERFFRIALPAESGDAPGGGGGVQAAASKTRPRRSRARSGTRSPPG